MTGIKTVRLHEAAWGVNEDIKNKAKNPKLETFSCFEVDQIWKNMEIISNSSYEIWELGRMLSKYY